VGYQLEPDIRAHYGVGLEGGRLTGWGRLEAIRTRELLDRYLPPAPATVYDIGGAEGPYALPLATAGYAVHLLDPFEPHVAAARLGSAAQPEAPLASAEVGDARELPYACSVRSTTSSSARTGCGRSPRRAGCCVRAGCCWSPRSPGSPRCWTAWPSA
jgi:hypothetical protein